MPWMVTFAPPYEMAVVGVTAEKLTRYSNEKSPSATPRPGMATTTASLAAACAEAVHVSWSSLTYETTHGALPRRTRGQLDGESHSADALNGPEAMDEQKPAPLTTTTVPSPPLVGEVSRRAAARTERGCSWRWAGAVATALAGAGGVGEGVAGGGGGATVAAASGVAAAAWAVAWAAAARAAAEAARAA